MLGLVVAEGAGVRVRVRIRVSGPALSPIPQCSGGVDSL